MTWKLSQAYTETGIIYHKFSTHQFKESHLGTPSPNPFTRKRSEILKEISTQLHRHRVRRITVPRKGLPLQPHFLSPRMMSRKRRSSYHCHRLSCLIRQWTRGFVVSCSPTLGGTSKYQRKFELSGKTRPHESQ